jgi:GDPmannose 4,6-dehydratase
MLAVWLMLQHDDPDDFVIASGKARTVRELARSAFSYLGLDARDYIHVDEQLLRSYEGSDPVGDPSKAQRLLGWKAETSFEDLIASMVESDLRLLREPNSDVFSVRK